MSENGKLQINGRYYKETTDINLAQIRENAWASESAIQEYKDTSGYHADGGVTVLER